MMNPFEVDRLVLTPDEIITSEDYDRESRSLDADIALLKFEEGKINPNHAYINPICIWNSNDDPLAKEGVLVGWERLKDSRQVTEPKQIKVTIQYIDECLEETPILAEISSNRTFCAGDRNGSKTCNGDSGSGLYIKIDGIWYLKGLISGGLKTDSDGCDPFAVYTYIYKFLNWIRQKTQGNYAITAKGKQIKLNPWV